MTRFASLLFLALVISDTQTLRILVLLPYPYYSHFLVFQPLMEGLISKEHDLTIVSPYSLDSSSEFYTHVDLSGSVNARINDFPLPPKIGRLGMHNEIGLLRESGRRICNATLSSDAFRDLLDSSRKFDLIVTEVFATNCILFAAYLKFRAPIVGITSHTYMPWSNVWIANPDNPSYTPVIFMDFYENMDFFGRVENSIAWVYNNWYYRNFIHRDDCELIQEKLQVGCDDYDAVLENISLILGNGHYSLHPAKPTVPAFVDVGGIHIVKSKEIPLVRMSSLIEKK